MTCAPAERNVRRDEYAIGYVSLLRSEENPVDHVFYKHFVPTGREAVQNLYIVTDLARKTRS